MRVFVVAEVGLRETALSAFQHFSIAYPLALQLALQRARAAVQAAGYKFLVCFSGRQQIDKQAPNLRRNLVRIECFNVLLGNPVCRLRNIRCAVRQWCEYVGLVKMKRPSVGIKADGRSQRLTISLGMRGRRADGLDPDRSYLFFRNNVAKSQNGGCAVSYLDRRGFLGRFQDFRLA